MSKSEPCELSAVLWMQWGEGVDSLAREMSRCYRRPVEAMRSVLLQNNGGPLLPGSPLFVGPEPLGPLRDRWLRERRVLESACLQLPEFVRELFREVPAALPVLTEFADGARQNGWFTGRDLAMTIGKSLVEAVGAPADVWSHALQEPLDAARQIHGDALRELGADAFDQRRSPARMRRLNQFITRHPAYGKLQRGLATLPAFAQGRLDSLRPLPGREAAWFRRHFAVPFEGGFQRTGQLARLMKADLIKLARVGAATAWVLPAAFAIAEAWQAPTALQRGRGIVSQLVAVPIGVVTANVLTSWGIYSALTLVMYPAGAFIVTATVVGGVAWGFSKIAELAMETLYDHFLPPEVAVPTAAPPAVIPPPSGLQFRGALR